MQNQFGSFEWATKRSAWITAEHKYASKRISDGDEHLLASALPGMKDSSLAVASQDMGVKSN